MKVLSGVSIGALVALGLLFVNLAVGVSKDAQIAISVAEQHGQELLAIRSEIMLIRDDLRDRTNDRYHARDAARDLKYLDKRLTKIEEILDDHGKLIRALEKNN